MSTHSLLKLKESNPSVFDDFFDSSGSWNRFMNVPAVNITDEKNKYKVALAVPGLKKEDFKIDIEGNILTISSEKEENKEEKNKKFTRMEYNYSSFSRSFTLPEEINKEKIEANYDNGVLKISLPRKEEAVKSAAKKHIDVK